MELAFKVLSWLSHCIRPLAIDELRTAVSIDKESNEIDPASLPSTETLIDICAGKVIIEENSRTVCEAGRSAV